MSNRGQRIERVKALRDATDHAGERQAASRAIIRLTRVAVAYGTLSPASQGGIVDVTA